MIRPEIVNGVLAVPKRQLSGLTSAKCAPTEKKSVHFILQAGQGRNAQVRAPLDPGMQIALARNAGRLPTGAGRPTYFSSRISARTPVAPTNQLVQQPPSDCSHSVSAGQPRSRAFCATKALASPRRLARRVALRQRRERDAPRRARVRARS
jgi:hypothetical protein